MLSACRVQFLRHRSYYVRHTSDIRQNLPGDLAVHASSVPSGHGGFLRILYMLMTY